VKNEVKLIKNKDFKERGEMYKLKTNEFFKIFRGLFTTKKIQSHRETTSENKMNQVADENLNSTLEDNIILFKNIFKDCSDIVYREFIVGDEQKISGLLIWLDGLADKNTLNSNIMKSLIDETRFINPKGSNTATRAFSLIRDSLLSVADMKEQTKINDIVDSVLTGESAILIDGVPISLIVSTKSWESRDVTDPITEGVVRGPRQGFTENVRTGTSLIRRIVKTPQLKMEEFKVGSLTKTDVIMAYIQGIASDKVVEEVRKRISRINVDSILESGYIEELIEDQPFSLFPQIEHTERPDKAAAQLLEGRVVILIDGTPFSLIVPTVFFQFLQSSEDYYERYPLGFAVRIVRSLAFALSLFLPSLYIAITTYHQEMLPTPLLISIAGGREGVPFPALVEGLLMEVTIEALREAGVRLPRPVGQAVSIVGALVVGQAAVQAGIVSSAKVIVVSVTAISSFSTPAFNLAASIRMIRFPMMILASFLGLYGVMLGVLILQFHLCSLRSFGVPYFAPFAPFRLSGLKDMIFRAPWWMMQKRPLYTKQNRKRQETSKPHPPHKD
jgi:spore germination protein KA